MTTRANLYDLPKPVFEGLMKTGHYISTSGLSPKLKEMLCYRVSQINGCAFCLDMHHKEAIHLGETETRLHSLAAWRECPFYTEGERAALAFAEAVTARHVDDETYAALTPHFSQKEIAILTLAMVNINSWNMLNAVFKPTPGEYKVGLYTGQPEAATAA